MMLIELKKIKKNYYKNTKKIEVLKDVNVRFWYKGFYALVGSSGSGKSTLLKIIAGLVNPTSGECLFKGRSIGIKDKDMSNFLNTQIGFVFQNYQLIESFSPIENVAFPLIIKGVARKEAEKRAAQLFRQFNLEKIMNQDISTLSGGEKQRVAVLRAMINNPSIFLLDEPTGALDKENSKLLIEMLKSIAKDKLVIMVTHNFYLAKKYADKIYLLKEGVLVEY